VAGAAYYVIIEMINPQPGWLITDLNHNVKIAKFNLPDRNLKFYRRNEKDGPYATQKSTTPAGKKPCNILIIL
jgi:hypothetical protein